MCIAAEIQVPARPENYLLDEGKVFPPEVEARVVAALKAAARDSDVHIYVMTMGSLNVMPSRAGETLDQTQKTVRQEWLAGRVGALIVFDNEAGKAVVGASDEAMKVFSPVAVNMALKDPDLQSRKKHLSPDKLSSTVVRLIQHFTDLRAKTNEEAQKRNTMNWIFAGTLGSFGLLGVAIFISTKMRPAPIPPKGHRKTVTA